jgi:hypothetical protein
MNFTIERSFHLGSQAGRRGGSRRVVREGPEPEPPTAAPTPGRIPRITKLMALAIRCEQLLRSGAVPDATALAHLAHVSQPRITHILNLTLLAPDIQEDLLDLPQHDTGKAAVNEKQVRKMTGMIDWQSQRVAWASFKKA